MSGLFSKFVIKEKKDDVVHSSGYAVTQNSGAMGSVSGQSFEERMNVEKNRKSIRRYRDSNIAMSGMSFRSKAETYDATAEKKNYGVGNNNIDGAGKTDRPSSVDKTSRASGINRANNVGNSGTFGRVSGSIPGGASSGVRSRTLSPPRGFGRLK